MDVMTENLIPAERVARAILVLRGQANLDDELASLYGVTTRELNQQAKRNRARLPDDFSFQLTAQEFGSLRSRTVISSWGGRRSPPWAFTEHGVIAAAFIPTSDTAVAVSVQVVRASARLRQLLASNEELAAKVASIERRTNVHDADLRNLAAAFLKLGESVPSPSPRRRIGIQADEKMPSDEPRTRREEAMSSAATALDHLVAAPRPDGVASPMLEQLNLFGEPEPAPGASDPAPPPPEPPPEPPAPAEPPVHPGQLGLFGAAAAARVAVEDLIAEGRFAEALTQARGIEAAHGAFFAVPDALSLEPLAPLDLDGSEPEVVRRAWRAARDAARNAWRRQDLARAILRRRTTDSAIDLVGDDAVLLADVAEMNRRGDREDVERVLVRDALLAGMTLEPDALADSVVRDVLREDMEPEWLACFGGIRGAWPVLRDVDVPGTLLSERDRALAFWSCLRVAMHPSAHPREDVLAARIRMRELHPELHALHMRAG